MPPVLLMGASQDGVAEGHAGGAEAGGLGFNVLHDEVDAVAAAGAAEERAEIAARHVREGCVAGSEVVGGLCSRGWRTTFSGGAV